MQLTNYPKAIAKLQKELLSLDQEIQSYQLYMKETETEVDNLVAFDSTLKNDAQRKAKRQQLLDERENYQEWKQAFTQVSATRKEVFIELCLRRNEFSVLKLEKREAIALLEVQAAS